MSEFFLDKGSDDCPLANKHPLLRAYVHSCDYISQALGIFAGLVLVLGVLVVCHMTFVRYVLGHSTVWQTEFATYAIAASMLLGSAYVLRTGGHVSVNILVNATKGTLQKALKLTASLVGLAFCIALAYAFCLYLLEAYHEQWTTGTTWNPKLWPAILPMALGSTMLSLQYIAEILKGDPR